MKLRVLVLFLIALLCVSAQGERIEQIDWSQGLVTARGKLNRNFGAADICHNIDLTRPGLGPRKGYSLVVDIPGIDSILWNGIDALDYRNGDKQLMVVADWADSGYAGLFVSDINGFGFGIIDSFACVPDTAATTDSIRTYSLATATWRVRIIRPTQGWIFNEVFDSLVTRAEVVDSMVAHINGESSITDYVTAVDNGDTLIIQENGSDWGVQIFLNDPSGDPTSYQFGTWDSTFASDSTNTMTAVANRFPSTGTPRFAQTRDQVYIVNGVSRARVFDGRYSSEYPARAPGEISVLPLDDAGTLEGYYRYMVKFVDPDTVLTQLTLLNAPGYISATVRVDSGQVMLYNFPPPLVDSFYNYAGLDDTVDVTIWRTMGDSRILDMYDTLWLVDTVALSSLANYATVTFTDTTSDATLRAGGGDIVVIGSFLAGWDSWNGLWLDTTDSDSSLGIFYDSTHETKHTQVPGAPSYIESDSIDGSSGIWHLVDSTVKWDNCAGFSWIVVFVDTLNAALVSDSGRSLNIFQAYRPDGHWLSYYTYPGGKKIQTGFARGERESMTIVLPRTPDTTIMAMLYRGPIRAMKFDTLYAKEWFNEWAYNTREVTIRGSDFEVSQYYLVGEYNPGDTVVDTVHYDSLLLRDPYRRNAPPEAPLDVVATGNRLVLMDRQNVYMGDLLDSGATFNVLQQKPIEPDDGDQNVTLWAQSQGVVKIAKNNSTYNLFRSGGIWQLPELSRHYGVVAPLSHASAPEGDYFLSADGVRLEREGIYRSRSIEPLLMSGQLINFKDVAISDLKTAIGVYFDNKYILSIPALDTAFVLNKKIRGNGEMSFGWSTWGLIMSGSAMFRVSNDNIIMPGDSLYFTIPGESKIYVFNDGIYDNGQKVIWQWRSGPSNKVDGLMRQVEAAEIYITSDDTVSLGANSLGLFSIAFYDEEGTTYSSENIHSIADLDTTSYLKFNQFGTDVGLFWRVFIGNTNLHLDPTSATTIEGLWLTVSKEEEYRSQ